MKLHQVAPDLLVLPLHLHQVAASTVRVEICHDDESIELLGSSVLELGHQTRGQLLGQVGLLLPGVAVVLLVLVGDHGLLGALTSQVHHLRRNSTRVPLNPNLRFYIYVQR